MRVRIPLFTPRTGSPRRDAREDAELTKEQTAAPLSNMLNILSNMDYRIKRMWIVGTFQGTIEYNPKPRDNPRLQLVSDLSRRVEDEVPPPDDEAPLKGVRIEPEAVDYLRRFPSLLQGVRAVTDSVADEFNGEGASLTLSVYHDPEIDRELLTLYVRLPKYGPDTMDRIREAKWRHEDLFENADGDFLATTDFRTAG